MDKYERKNRISEALNIRNMKQVELCEKTKIKKSSLNNWIAQRWQPKQEPLYKMARALDVSELWLAGYDVPMERPIEQKKADELAALIHQLRKDSELLKILNLAIKLNGSQKKMIEVMMSELIKADSQE